MNTKPIPSWLGIEEGVILFVIGYILLTQIAPVFDIFASFLLKLVIGVAVLTVSYVMLSILWYYCKKIKGWIDRRLGRETETETFNWIDPEELE